jgi:hypothetical protein
MGEIRMLKYKLTTQDNLTFNDTKWGENVTRTASGIGELCGPGWLHYYHNPYLAILLNPVHADISNPKLWECEAEGEHKDDCGLKGGCTKLTMLKVIPLPKLSLVKRVEFAIRCAVATCKVEKFQEWANNWLDGVDRSERSAYALRDSVVYRVDVTGSCYFSYQERYVVHYTALAASYADVRCDTDGLVALSDLRSVYERTISLSVAHAINYARSPELLAILETVLKDSSLS